MIKKFFLLIIFLILALLIFLLVNLNIKNRVDLPIYPVKSSISEEWLADISRVFRANQKRIEVNLSQQKARIFENGRLVNEFLVSTGRDETPTPQGEFKVLSKHVMIYSKISKCWLPFWVGFTKDGLYGFHELPICPDGRRGAEEIGRSASIGCVRLNIWDSENFYKWVKIGTPITIVK